MHKLKIINTLEKYGIEIISSDNPEFDSMVKDYHGKDEELLAFIESIKPFPLFVKNSSEAHVCVTSFSWVLTARDGKLGFSPSGCINMGFIHNRKMPPSEHIKSYAEIPSGSSKFYSYIELPFDLLQKSNEFKARSGGIGFSMSSEKEMLFKNFVDVAFCVEGILFSDGRFVGEDRHFMFGTVGGILKAEKDFGRKVKEMREKGLSDAEIIEKAKSKSDERIHHREWVNPPQNLKESFKRSYLKTIESLRQTIYRQKTMTQLSDEKIINMAIDNLYKSDFEIRRVK